MNQKKITTKSGKTIEFAKEMGFCFGVRRVIDEIKQIGKGKGIYALGKLIQNPQVIKELEKDGFKTVEDYRNISDGTIIISAHGVPDNIINEINKKGLKVIDLTCPLVKKLHGVAKNAESRGRMVIVYGDKKHTEVKGIVGNLKNYKVIMQIEEMDKNDFNSKITLVSQTTRDVEGFNEISKKIKEKSHDVEIKDTICSATKERQKSAVELAKKSDIIIVIGGKMSSNTIRLAEICEKYCDTKHIETEKELKKGWFIGKKRVGITAGASTPDEIIEKVFNRIQYMAG